MKKLFLTLALALLSTGIALAVPAKPVTRTMTQSDGSRLSVRTVGDEFHRAIVTEDGLQLTRAANGDFHYVNTTILAHNPDARTAAEQQYVESNAANLTFDAPSKVARQMRSRANSARKATQVPTLDSPRVPIILVTFKNKDFIDEDPHASYEAFFAEGNKSCYQYFVDQSRGKFTPQFDVIGPVALDNNYAYYGGNKRVGSESIDKNIGTMIYDAVTGAKELDETIDFSVYDNTGDGVCDVMIVLYAGEGEATSTDTNTIWPMQWEMEDCFSWGCSTTGAFVIDGVKIDKFAVFNEAEPDYFTGEDVVAGIGTFCHEFSHCLGLPDFYDTNYGNHFGMGMWSLLDMGCYCDDGYTPCGYTAYEKNFMGWFDYETPEPDSIYSMKAITSAEGTAYKLSSNYQNEYFILENRQKTGWDTYLPSHGMMITHVTYDQGAWDGNYVNDYDPQRMVIMPADNSLKMNYSWGGGYQADEADMKGDLYPYQKGTNLNNEFTDESEPAAKLNGGGYLGKPVTEITEQDGIISFYYMKAALQKDDPVLEAATDTTSTSFTAHWTAVENVNSYTLWVKNVTNMPVYELLLKETFPQDKFNTEGTKDISSELNNYMENEGWTGKVIYKQKGGIRLGTAKNVGSLTSPNLDLTRSGGTITVKVKTKSYNTDSGCKLTVSCGGAEQTIDVGSEKTQTLILEVPAEADQQVTFANQEAKKRVVIKGIEIYAGDGSNVEPDEAPMRVTETGDDNLRIIEGITDNFYTVEGLIENNTYKYKVKAVYTDDTEGNWSEPDVITLLEGEVPEPLFGDVNHDGKVNVTDVNLLVSALLNGTVPEGYDLNDDGVVNVTDVNLCVSAVLLFNDDPIDPEE